MPESRLLLLALAGCWACVATVRAQDAVFVTPPPPATRLERFETNTGTILIKATSLIGSMSVNGNTVTVTCKEDTELHTGRKEHGIVIGLPAVEPATAEDRTIVDYDELGPLLDAMEVLAKMDWTGISLTSFHATYETTGGFRVAAFSARRSGSIEHSIRSGRMSRGIVLTQSQLAELRGLLHQARRKLDDLRAK